MTSRERVDTLLHSPWARFAFAIVAVAMVLLLFRQWWQAGVAWLLASGTMARAVWEQAARERQERGEGR